MNHHAGLYLLGTSIGLGFVNKMFNSQTLLTLQILAALGAVIFYVVKIYLALKQKKDDE